MLATVAHAGTLIGGGFVLVLLLSSVALWLSLLQRFLRNGVPSPVHVGALQHRHWSGVDLLHVGVWVSSALLLFAIANLFVQHAGLGGDWLHVVAALQNTILQVLVGVVLMIRVHASGRSMHESFSTTCSPRNSRTSICLQAVKWYILVLPLVLIASLFSQQIFAQADQEHAFQPILIFFTSQATPSWFRWWVVGIAVLLAPVVEECLFRGVMLPVLMRRYRVATSILVCALLFALMHGHLPSLLPLSALGVGLGAAYVYTGNLLVVIAMHAIFNSVSLLVLVLAGLPSLA